MSEGKPFRLLVLADLHYDPTVADDPAAHRRCALGREMIARAAEDARRNGGFDAVAVMGDLLDDGTKPSAPAAIAELRAELEATKVPVLVVPGNHDPDPEALLAGLGAAAGVREIGGYRFIVFADRYVENVSTRGRADMELVAAEAARSGPPIVVLQHNPISPPIVDAGYPYMHANRDEIAAAYARAGVLLSISGHYHAGQALNVADGVSYFTAAAAAEAPFRYAIVTLRGRGVSAEVRSLAVPAGLDVWDTHAHTEFAYCGRGISGASVIARCRTFGLAGVCLVEHAPQLYCSAEDFWAGRHVHEPASWRGGDHSRIAEFRAAMAELRGPGVRVGLEVELDADDRLTIRDADREWADLLVGAIHFLREDAASLTDAELAKAVMRTNEAILAGGVDVLAHPWRIFRWTKRPVPPELYRPLAEMLAATSTAAEVNFHHNRPEADFLAECLRAGVKIAFGSDTHVMSEAGGMSAHVRLLRQAAGTDDIGPYLWRPCS